MNTIEKIQALVDARVKMEMPVPGVSRFVEMSQFDSAIKELCRLTEIEIRREREKLEVSGI
jgi:hypothetical protein